MSNYNYQNRNLSEVFKELQEAKNAPRPKTVEIRFFHILIAFAIIVIGISLSLSKNVLAKSNELDDIKYELNENQLDIQTIVSQNADVSKYKEKVETESDVQFDTTRRDNASLPKGEEVVVQEGVLGKDKITSVKTYEDQDLKEELFISSERILEPVEEIIDVGTSEFLANQKVHVGDTMYLLKDTSLRESASTSATKVAEGKKYIDVKLTELISEEWCKISLDDKEGYVQTANLTSSSLTPNIVNKNRIQKLLLKVNSEMELNKSSNLTLDDYKTIFTGLSNDTNNIFQDNYEVFYNADKNYNINGIFLASIGIHESGWGTSQISKTKKNLFGYGSYDSDPYSSSFEFESYSEGIETVAKSLVKYYLNPAGTKIYDDEVASGKYYNGSTIKDVNIRYASDEEWHTKVYSYMELLYNRLESLL